MGETQCVIEIAGKVQLVGFRNFVEANARTLGLEGSVFNDRNGRVKILCGGPEKKIDALLQLIELGSSEMGAVIESMEKREIPVHLPLPPTFFKEPTVELMDIKDRLDEGVGVLKSMDRKLGGVDEKLGGVDQKLVGMDRKLVGVDEKLGGMDKKLGGIDEKLGGMDEKLEGIDEKLGGMDEKMSGMDQKLGGIDEKLGGMGKKLGALEKLDTLEEIKHILAKMAAK